MREPYSVVLGREVSLAALRAYLAAEGFVERPVAAHGPPLIAGEPELAQWHHPADDTTLTYTFQPVVGLRVARLAGRRAAERGQALGAALVCEDVASLAASLAPGPRASDARTALRAILAAGEIRAASLAGPIGLFAAHAEPAVAEAAARVHLDLLHAQVRALLDGGRASELARPLAAIAGNAMPVLAALVDAGADVVMGLAPTAEDCQDAFVGQTAEHVFMAYDALFANPPLVKPGPDRTDLQVRACPAELLGAENAFSRGFAIGFHSLAPYLRPGRVWLAWKYCRPGASGGLALDGLVHVRGSWVWFPRAYAVVGRIVQQRLH